jgi:N-acetylmuramoyl-L-alanine amidase
MNNRIVLIDCGHGGLHPDTKEYTTIDKKYYHFTEHNETIYEGVLNRQFGEHVYKLVLEAGMTPIYVNHKHFDTDLDDRVDMANAIHKVHKNCLYVSLHNNAASATLSGDGSGAKGTEIYTYIGQSESDEIVESIFDKLDEYNPAHKQRVDTRDGDRDKEAKFHVLKYTKMPALLVEFDFFDNWESVQKLLDIDWQYTMSKAIVDGIKEHYK